MNSSRLLHLFVVVLVAASSLAARQDRDGTQPRVQDNTTQQLGSAPSARDGSNFNANSKVTRIANEKQLEVTTTKTGQQNCRPGSSDLPVVRLKLRLEITNLTDKKLIISKSIGAASYGMTVAKDEHALAAGDYESNANLDWSESESNAQRPPTNAPPAEFIILGPEQSFATEWVFYVLVQRETVPASGGLLKPGIHVLQLDLGTWLYVQRPEQFKESWKKYGELVYEPVKSEPLQFLVPPYSDFAECKP
jgi:hypothetical protein